MDQGNTVVIASGDAYVAAPEKKSRKKWVIIGIIIVLAAAVVVVAILLINLSAGTKIGNANNGGDGEIVMMTAGSGSEGTTNYYRISTSSEMYKMNEINFSREDGGLVTIPLSCARTAFYGADEDAAACDSDSDSANSQKYGGEFFSVLRYALYDVFDVADLGRRAVLLSIFESSGRVFLSMTLNESTNVSRNYLFEYVGASLVEVTKFETEMVRWVEVRGAEE